MTYESQVYWIDDDSSRQSFSDSLSTELDLQVQFIDVNSKVVESVESILNELIKGKEPGLVILDHVLNLATSDTYKTGSTAASFLREKWPACPIISVTNALEDIDIRHRAAYENIFALNRVSEHYGAIKALYDGNQKLRNNTAKSPSTLIENLNCSESDGEKIMKILPKELKEDFTDVSINLEFYRWFQDILSERPGFLYDKTWAATYLGLNDAGFESVSALFSEARYSGVFSDPDRPRWWKSKLLEILSANVDQMGLPWVTGRALVGDNKFHSKCASSGEEYPETVAALDMTPNTEWHPMKMKYTESHPSFEDMLFFEELRIMIPA